MARAPRKKLAVFKFASCDGCQLSLLDCEDEILTLADVIEIAHFNEATQRSLDGPYDLTLVEGSITTHRDLARIEEVRAASRYLVTIGACACSGGIQALRNFRDVQEFLSIVYARPDYIDTLSRSTPISTHVPVDFELQGCPVDKRQLLEVIASYLHDKAPTIPRHALCVDCKLAGQVCVMVAHGTPCMGPVTQAGCGVLCPRFQRGCYGCFGPRENPEVYNLGKHWQATGVPARTIQHLFRNFNAWDPTFREESARHDEP